MWFRLLFALAILFNATAMAQITGTVTPTPTPRPGSRQAGQPAVAADTERFDRMRVLDMMADRNRKGSHPLLDPKKGIYRRPGKEEIAVLAVAEPVAARFAKFLEQPDTGIVKLNAESSCISDEDVVVASEKCIAFKMPGSGASYSFRTESYRLPRLSDVILLNGVFKTGGVLQQVVMADIGDFPIEDVALETAAMKFLTELKPVRGSDEFMQFDSATAKGIEANGFTYRKGQLVKENTTFVLRSIAYRGNYIRAIEGVSYDELDFDRRRDVIVAFRVVDKDPSGNITILWKRLADVEAPRLKVKK